MPKLTVAEKGVGKEQVFEFGRDGATIGRSSDNTVVLQDNSISRKHAHIIIEDNNCFLIDLGSGSGTFLNGATITPKEKTLLKHGDMISIEKFNLHYSQIDEMLASSFNEITDSDILEVKLLKKVLRAIDKDTIPSIEVLNGNFAGKKLFITEEMCEIVIGRDPESDFAVEEYVISRKHAKLVINSDGIAIEDLNSKNGTYLNNRRITKETLHDGDRIAFGTIVLIFRNPKEVDLKGIGETAKQRQGTKGLPTGRHGEERGTSDVERGTWNVEHSGLSSTGSAQESELEDFGGIEELPADEYPTPSPRRERISLSFFEMGMIGLGVLILVFAAISLVNLLAK